MKKIVLTLILLILFMPKALAFENIVSSLVIDSAEEREIEVVMDKDKMYLPCKYILKFFGISYTESHAEKSLSFKNVLVKGWTLSIDGKKQTCPVFFVKTGITGISNEYFISADVLSKILEKNITSNSNQLLVAIKTKSDTEVATKKYENPFLKIDTTQKPQAYDEITLPIQTGTVSLDSIGFTENMMSDSYSQLYIESQSKNCTMMNNMQVKLAGKLYSGKYKLDLGTNSYSNNLFSFSGISPQYKNQYKNFDYLIGTPDVWDFADSPISTEILGFQVKDHIEPQKDYKSIDGYVCPTSTIKVHINNDFEQEISTYGGYYTLKNICYGKPVRRVKIDEILADGTKKEVLTKEYKGDEGKKSVPAKDFILGVSGLQNRLWANNGYIYQTLTKKLVLGGKTKKELSDKVTFENFITADKIYEGYDNDNWMIGLVSGKRYLNFATLQNPNALEGETYMGALTYKNNEDMASKFYFGVSNSKANDGITSDGLGYFLRSETNYYLNKDTSLVGSVFVSSPSFYMAGSSSGSGFSPDRAGSSITGNTSFKNLSFSGTYSKYKSNFGNYYEGGLITYDEYNFSARAHFKRLPSLSLKINNRHGANELGSISSNSYELSGNKKLKCFAFDGGIRKSIYDNTYNVDGYTGYSSEFSDTFMNVSFPLGKKFGYMTLGNDIVETTSDGTKNDYNSFLISYTTPSINGYNVNMSTGIHYSGTTKGNDIGLGITKRLKSGSTVSLNYRYSQTPYYMIDNMYIPGSMRHSITVDFSELYGIGNHGLQAIGAGNEDKGYLQVTAFLDVNQNGVRDKNEPLIENIPIKIENDSEVFLTTKDGTTKLKPEDPGVYNVKIFEDELPNLVSCHNKTKPSRYVKINNNSKTKLEFGLISSVGNINGSVLIKDEFDNVLKIEDLVVSVLDFDGKEVNYTNLNDDGTFSFSGLSPGKYFVGIDKELQETYKIVPEKDSENVKVEIPPVYKDYVNIDNVNLTYKYLT